LLEILINKPTYTSYLPRLNYVGGMFCNMNSTQIAQNVLYDDQLVIIQEMYYTMHHT
jgi:hypothetical protein